MSPICRSSILVGEVPGLETKIVIAEKTVFGIISRIRRLETRLPYKVLAVEGPRSLVLISPVLEAGQEKRLDIEAVSGEGGVSTSQVLLERVLGVMREVGDASFMRMSSYLWRTIKD